MREIPTQIRVRPLRTKDLTSQKFSVKKSIDHDTRVYDESHIDKSRTKFNMVIGEPEKIFEKIQSLKDEYGTIKSNTTIDCANFIMTVNKTFFEENKETSQDMKKAFLVQAKKFVEKEFETPHSFLAAFGHDDEDGFHVHLYACPIVKSEQKNRYGTSEKVTINYRHKYSETQEDIKKARDEGKSSELKTGLLQDRWAEHISKVFPELVRGKKNSGKKNISPKEYRESKELEKINEEKKAENMKLNLEIYKKEIDLENIEKSMQKMLRENVKIKEVAELCGVNYFPEKIEKDGKQLRVRNAIDYLVYVQNCSYSGAVAFLHKNFGENATKNEQLKHVKESSVNEFIEPKYIRVKKDVISEEFKALGNPIVRVTATKIKTDEKGNQIIDEKGKQIKETIVIGKSQKTGKEVFFNRKEILEKLPQLNLLNANGYNIFITPIEYAEPRNFVQIVVDDVKDISSISNAIGEPNLVIETSPKNYQCVYNIKNEILYTDEKEKGDKNYRRRYLNFFNEVNNIYGDKSISGLRHPFRLAGFINQKPNREPVFAKIVSSSDHENNHLFETIMSDKYDKNPKQFKKEFIQNQTKISVEISSKTSL